MLPLQWWCGSVLEWSPWCIQTDGFPFLKWLNNKLKVHMLYLFSKLSCDKLRDQKFSESSVIQCSVTWIAFVFVLLRPQFVYRNWCYIPFVSWHVWKVLTSWTSNGEEMMIVRDESGVAEVSNGNPTWWHHPKRWLRLETSLRETRKHKALLQLVQSTEMGWKDLAKWVGPFFLAVEL